jgi:hypothetical protein
MIVSLVSASALAASVASTLSRHCCRKDPHYLPVTVAKMVTATAHLLNPKSSALA